MQGGWNVAAQLFEDLAQPFSRGRLAVKTVDIRRKYHQDWHNRTECLHALDHVSIADLLHEFLEKTERKLLCNHVCH